MLPSRSPWVVSPRLDAIEVASQLLPKTSQIQAHPRMYWLLAVSRGYSPQSRATLFGAGIRFDGFHERSALLRLSPIALPLLGYVARPPAVLHLDDAPTYRLRRGRSRTDWAFSASAINSAQSLKDSPRCLRARQQHRRAAASTRPAVEESRLLPTKLLT